MAQIYEQYKTRQPPLLTAEFTNRLDRPEAIQRQEKRRRLETPLVPSGRFTKNAYNYMVFLEWSLFAG